MAVWGFAGKDGGYVFDGVRFAFDARRNLVSLMMGNLCVDQMTLFEYEQVFGLFAARGLLRGE